MEKVGGFDNFFFEGLMVWKVKVGSGELEVDRISTFFFFSRQLVSVSVLQVCLSRSWRTKSVSCLNALFFQSIFLPFGFGNTLAAFLKKGAFSSPSLGTFFKKTFF